TEPTEPTEPVESTEPIEPTEPAQGSTEVPAPGRRSGPPRLGDLPGHFLSDVEHRTQSLPGGELHHFAITLRSPTLGEQRIPPLSIEHGGRQVTTREFRLQVGSVLGSEHDP